MAPVLEVLARAARSDVSVLLEGETGVGKDVLARTLHDESPRRGGPFLVFDCGAVAPHLIASELFGHAEGAFTGAVAARAGIFEAAAGGTVLLDEIGELSTDLQPSLLRALESRRVRRVGEVLERPIDVRVVAATHRRLDEEADAGRFRRDLLFRLAVVRVAVPPLRERPEDIVDLAEHLLARCRQDRRSLDRQAGAPSIEAPASSSSLDDEQRARLVRYRWPGNVRELRNVIERSFAVSEERFEILGLEPDEGAEPSLAEGDDVGAADLLGLPWKEAKDELVRRFERRYLAALLERHDGNVSRAARAAEVARGQLHRQLARHGLRLRDRRRRVGSPR